MAGKRKNSSPSSAKQKERSIRNKVKQLEAHLRRFPEDSNAERKLKSARAGRTRGDTNVHPTEKILTRYADGRVKRDDKSRKGR